VINELAQEEEITMTPKSLIPKFGIFSILAPVAAIFFYGLIGYFIGASDTAHGFFKVFLIVEILWYFSIAGSISGFMGIKKKEKLKILGYIGAVGNGLLAIYLAFAIFT